MDFEDMVLWVSWWRGAENFSHTLGTDVEGFAIDALETWSVHHF
jgi:hypothetical protein